MSCVVVLASYDTGDSTWFGLWTMSRRASEAGRAWTCPSGRRLATPMCRDNETGKTAVRGHRRDTGLAYTLLYSALKNNQNDRVASKTGTGSRDT